MSMEISGSDSNRGLLPLLFVGTDSTIVLIKGAPRFYWSVETGDVKELDW